MAIKTVSPQNAESIIIPVPRLPLRLIFTIAIAALSLILLTWSLSPPGRLARQQSLQPDRTGLPEMHQLNLDFPITIRAGDADQAHLTLEPGDLVQAVGDPDVYATDDILAELRLEMVGMDIYPSDTVIEPLRPGQSLPFFWSLRPRELGRLTGTLWFYLRFIPKNGGPERRQAISAQEIEIESTTLFGLQAEAARWLGLAGVFISSLLGFSFFVDALKWLWQHRKTYPT